MLEQLNASPAAVGVGIVLAGALLLVTVGAGLPLLGEVVAVVQRATGDVLAAVAVPFPSDGAAATNASGRPATATPGATVPVGT